STGATAVAVATIPAMPPGTTGAAKASVMVRVGVGVGVGMSKNGALAVAVGASVGVMVSEVVMVASGARSGPVYSSGNGTTSVMTVVRVSSGDAATCVAVGNDVQVGVGRRVAVDVAVAVASTAGFSGLSA